MVNIWLRSLTRTWAHRQTQEDGGRGEQIGIACDAAVFSLCLLNCTKGERHGGVGGAEGESSASGVVCILILQVHPSWEG